MSLEDGIDLLVHMIKQSVQVPKQDFSMSHTLETVIQVIIMELVTMEVEQ
jgi:hypothetical protein